MSQSINIKKKPIEHFIILFVYNNKFKHRKSIMKFPNIFSSKWWQMQKKNLHEESFYEYDKAIKDSWIIREKEMHSNPFPYFRTSHATQLLLGELFSNIYDIDKSEICELSIINGNDKISITEKDNIWEYDIFKHYKNLDPCNQNHIFYTLLYRSKKEIQQKDKSVFNADGAIMMHTNAITYKEKRCTYIDLSICIPTFVNIQERYNHKVRTSVE